MQLNNGVIESPALTSHCTVDRFFVQLCFISTKILFTLTQDVGIQAYYYHRSELIKPATELFRHNLTGTLEASVRATNAQYDDTDILQRLDVRILEVGKLRTCNIINDLKWWCQVIYCLLYIAHLTIVSVKVNGSQFNSLQIVQHACLCYSLLGSHSYKVLTCHITQTKIVDITTFFPCSYPLVILVGMCSVQTIMWMVLLVQCSHKK